MTQQELADELGMAQSQVSRYRARGMPTHSPEAARAWIRQNIRLSMNSPQYRRTQPQQRRSSAAPTAQTPGELYLLATEVVYLLNDCDDDPADFDEGIVHLKHLLCALPLDLATHVLMPLRVHSAMVSLIESKRD